MLSPADVASVITLGSPLRGEVCHPNILKLAEQVRKNIMDRHGDGVLPACYTGQCGCDFVNHITRERSASVNFAAVYTKTDAIVDWRYCMTGDSAVDIEVPGTHLGLVFNLSAYAVMPKRLAAARQVDHDQSPVT